MTCWDRSYGAFVAACVLAGALGAAPALLAGCGSASLPSEMTMEQRRSIDVQEVDMAYVEAHLADATLIDVRTAEEYERGHIAGAVNIDSATFDPDQLFDELIGFDDPLILYCRTGRRADAVARELVAAGYGDVRVYKPGYPEWADAHP